MLTKTISRSDYELQNTTSDYFIQGYLPLGIDLAKNVFQVNYVDPKDGKMINRKLTRKGLKELIEGFAVKLFIAIESCGSSHSWARYFMSLGHKVKIIPASFVRTLHNANKDDRNDSYWIWQALRSMNTGSIAVRSEEEQILQATFKLRELFVTQRTRQLNNLRALLYEMGEAVPLGQQKLLEHVAEFEAAQTERGCTGLADLTLLLNSTRKAIETQDELIEELTETIKSKAQEDQTCSLLMTIPGVGPLTAVALSLVMGKPENFRNARQFAAYAGFAPVHTGTGGKITVLGVSRRGKGILKKMLGEASMSVTCFKADTSPWIASLLERKPKRVVACAVANKICRIAWAICSSGKPYDYTKTNIGIPKGA